MAAWGNAEKRYFYSALPQGDYAMLITQKHHRENTSPEYDQSTGLMRPCSRYRMASYSTTFGIKVYYHKY